MTYPFADLERCQTYVTCHLGEARASLPHAKAALPFITLSRQTGAGGRSVADCVKQQLDELHPLPCEWTVFDKNLVQRAMEDHGLPERFASYLPDDKVSEFTSLMGELVGLHPNLWELNHKVCETMLHLGMMGGAILVGRGANFVTAQLKQGFHVRLVGSYKKRIKRAAGSYGLSEAYAESFVKKEDGARKRLVKDSFDADIDDPLCYDMVINTDHLECSSVASIIVKGMLKRHELLEKKHAEHMEELAHAHR